MGTKFFGKTKDDEEVYIYELVNANGMRAEILNYGAILKSLYLPSGDDVVLGYDSVAEYEVNGCFFGAVIAPSANRIGNASFEIDGVKYDIDVNDGPNNLHSHIALGSHKKIWDAKKEGNSVILNLKMADMELGFPGNKEFTIKYTLTDKNELKLEYTAKSDKNTIINPTNHSYFNLAGHDSGCILGNYLTLNASNYTYVAEGAIPTGEIASVKGTVMDFTSPRMVGQDIDNSFEQLVKTGGYDHNFVIDGWDGTLKHIATVEERNTNRSMDVYSDLPGVQFYAGNFITKQKGKSGATYSRRAALCLETQYFPDSIHHDNFPSCVFGPNKSYKSETVYAFKF